MKEVEQVLLSLDERADLSSQLLNEDSLIELGLDSLSSAKV